MRRATRRLLQHGANHAVVTSCRWASHCHPARNARTGVARTDLPSSANVGKRHRQTRTTVTVTQSLLVVAGLTALLGRFHTGWATVSLVLLLAVAAAFFLLLVRLQRSGPMQLGTRVLGRVFPQSRLVAKFEDRAVAGDARLTTFYRSERATFVGAGCWHM